MLCLTLTELFALEPGIQCLKSPVWKCNTWKTTGKRYLLRTVDFKAKDCVWSWGFMFYCAVAEMLSTWPYTEKGTLLVERYFITKLGRKKQGQKSCPRAKRVFGLCQAHTMVLIVLQYGKTLYDNYKCAVKKAGLSSRWANQKVVEPAAPAGSSSAGTDTVTAADIYCPLLLCCIVFVQKSHPWIQQDVFL